MILAELFADPATWALVLLGILGILGGIAAWLLAPIWRKIDNHEGRISFLESGMAEIKTDVKWIREFMERQSRK